MFTERREHSLPVVEERPDHLPKSVELLVAVIECDIPGYGIVSDPERVNDREENSHLRHEQMVLEAAKHLSERYTFEDSFKGRRSRVHQLNLGMHGDMNYQGATRLSYWADYCSLRLRLHTAEESEARVLLLNSAPGLFVPITDVIDREGRKEDTPAQQMPRGYDSSLDDLSKQVALQALSLDRAYVDTILAEPDHYTYRQAEGDSVLFRSASHIGPISLHQFANNDGSSAGRLFTVSNLFVKA